MCVQLHIKIKGNTLDNWLCFYFSEPHVLQKLQAAKAVCTDTDLTEQAFSNMERDADGETRTRNPWIINPVL